MQSDRHEVDLNQAEVITKIVRIGKTTYVNIATGQRTDVEWGTGDWLSGIALGILASTLVLISLGILSLGIFVLFHCVILGKAC